MKISDVNKLAEAYRLVCENERRRSEDIDLKVENFIEQVFTKAPFDFELHRVDEKGFRTGMTVVTTVADRPDIPNLGVYRYNDEDSGGLVRMRVSGFTLEPYGLQGNRQIELDSYLISVPFIDTNTYGEHWSKFTEHVLTTSLSVRELMQNKELLDGVKLTYKRFVKAYTNPTEENYIDFLFDIKPINGVKHVKSRYSLNGRSLIRVPSGMDPAIFRDCVIEGDFGLRDDEPDFRNAPAMVTGKFYTYDKKAKLDGLKPGYGAYSLHGFENKDIEEYFERLKAKQRLEAAVEDDDELGLTDLFDNI